MTNDIPNEKQVALPLPLRPPDRTPDFPIKYLPTAIQNYVNLISEEIMVSPDMAATYSLAILSLCCQQKAKIRFSDTWTEELNLYVCIIADPSEGKSPVFKAMIRPVNEYVQQYNQAHAMEIQNNIDIRESLIMKKNNAKKKGGSPDEIRKINQEIAKIQEMHALRLMTTDSTNEALTDLLQEQAGKIGIMYDEGGIFDVAAGLYSENNSNINTYLCAYDGQSIFVDRITRCVEIPRATLTVGIFAQYKVLSSLLSNASFTGKGLTQRFIYCLPESRIGTRSLSPMQQPEKSIEFRQAETAYRQLIHALLKLPATEQNTCLTLTKESRILFADYYNTIESRLGKGGEFEEYRDYFGKSAGRTLRIAGLLHLAECQDIHKPVDGNTMLHAIFLSEYFISQTMKILGCDKYNTDTDFVLEKLIKRCKKENTNTISVRQINKDIRNRLSEERLTDALLELEKHNYIQFYMPPKNQYNGRSKGFYTINPHCLSRNC